MVINNSDIIFPGNSGQVRAIHGDLTLRANEDGGGDIIVGSGGSLRPEVNCDASDAIDLGEENLRWKDLYACSGNFLERPSVTGADNRTSGIALQQENYYIETSFAFDVAAGLSIAEVFSDEISQLPFSMMSTQQVKLHPSFAILTQHGTGSLPSEWVLELIKNDSLHVASGFFRWNPADFVNEITFNSWDILSETDIILNTFPGTTDTYGLIVHNDGSGTLVDGVFGRVTIGWTVHGQES